MRCIGFALGLFVAVGTLGFAQMAAARCAFLGVYEYAPLTLVSLVDEDDVAVEADEFEELSWTLIAGHDGLELEGDYADETVVYGYLWEGGE